MKKLGGFIAIAAFLGFCWFGFNAVESRESTKLLEKLDTQKVNNGNLELEVKKLRQQIEECNSTGSEETEAIEATEDDSN